MAKTDDIISGYSVGDQRIDNLVDYASADRRLANIKTRTVGILYSWKTSFKDAKISARLDHFIQTDNDKRLTDLRGWIAQIAARFQF